MIGIYDDAPVIEQCGHCDNGIQGDQYCRYCGGDGVDVFDRSVLFTLGHNLMVAAALCHAHRLGRVDRHFEVHGINLRWQPGCGRSAP